MSKLRAHFKTVNNGVWHCKSLAEIRTVLSSFDFKVIVVNILEYSMIFSVVFFWLKICGWRLFGVFLKPGVLLLPMIIVEN